MCVCVCIDISSASLGTPTSTASVSVKRGERRQRADTQGGGHATTEAKRGGEQAQPKTPRNLQSWETQKAFFSEPSEGAWPCPNLDL